MDAIAAIATHGAVGGVGIIRLSGPDALQIGSPISRTADEPNTRHLYYGNIVSSDQKTPADHGLFVWMKGPKSFTGRCRRVG